MSERWNDWSRGGRRALSRRAVIRGGGLAGLGVAGAALIGCSSSESTTPTSTPTASATATATTAATPTGTPDPYAGVKRGGTLHLTTTGDPPTIDPYGNNSFLTKGFAVYHYSRLYKLETGPNISAGAAAPTGDLAETAETTDGQHWTVKLRPGVKFHNVAPVNGRSLDAEDLAFSWTRFNDETNILRDGLSFITKFEPVDDTTISITLDAPSAIFLDALADANLLFILPKEAYTGFDPALTSIGTGPWILDDYQASTVIKRSAFPDYFLEGLPFLDGIETAVVPEYATRLAQFQAGNVDALGVNANDVLDLRKQMADAQWTGSVSALMSLFYWDHIMDTSKPWSDDRVRKAVSMAIDRDAITDLAYNVNALSEAGLDVSKAWNNMIPVGHTRWWLDPQSADQGESAQFFKYSPDEAAKLLDAASPGGLEAKYQYTDNRYGSTFNSVAEANIGYLEAVGFKLKTDIQDYSSVYITQTGNGDFEGLAFGYETPFPEAGSYADRPFGVDENGDPVTKNRSKIVDQDIIDINQRQAREVDSEARKQLLWQFQRINAEKMYYAPNQAGAGTSWTAYQPTVRGIRQTRGYGAGVETELYYWLDT